MTSASGYFKYNPVASKPTGVTYDRARHSKRENQATLKPNGLGSFILAGSDPAENGTASKGEGLVISSFGDGSLGSLAATALSPRANSSSSS